MAILPQVTPAAAADPQASGAELARQLGEACAGLARKHHLADPDALGRPPTADELAIHAAAVAATTRAAGDLARWEPQTWEAFADKSEALHRAALDGCVALDVGLAELLGDLQRLVAEPGGVPEAALPVLAREVERRREVPDGIEEDDDAPRMELFFIADLALIRAPCTTLASAAAKVRAVLDPTIGLEATGGGADDPPCLKQVLAVLEREAGPATSPLAKLRSQAQQLAAAAELMGDAEEAEGGDWLGMPLIYRAEALCDRVHLAPCTTRADALEKLDAALKDVEDVSDLEVLAGVLTFSLQTVRAWLASEPQPSATGVTTRAGYRGMPEIDREAAEA